jgi:hypothetical protein
MENESQVLKSYAHVENGIVVNVSVWDGESDWTPLEEIIEIPEGVTAGIGWSWTGEKFVDDRPEIIETNQELTPVSEEE